MLKTLKWNLKDHFRRYSLVYFGMVLALLLAVIPEKGDNFVSSLMITFSGILGFILFAAGFVLAINACLRWLGRESHLLELSNPLPTWKILLSKIVLAGLVNLVTCVFILQLSTFWARYSTGELTFINGSNLKGIPSLVLFFLLIDCTILFSYILARSITLFRRASTIVTGLLSSLLLIGIITLCMGIMSVNGLLVLPTINTKDIITLSGAFEMLSTVFPVVYAGIIILLEFAGCSILLARRFQQG
ncbi:MAG: hypothetical protein CVU42_01950 [Chloroflexi bacterium HGW-Chloroflexi-4]|jgi:hypothetical protein|nr:MAG: hypothetical protein CVU42_01950 [Chloroflexi bacterium HGW-Chloroflexi-4]